MSLKSQIENRHSKMENLAILALAAHRDDVEQTCGGTLLKMAELGHRTGILDLTQGEMGTRGTKELREREANEAARILRVSWRSALDIPDGRVENTWENKLKIVRVLRQSRPRVLILPYWQGRHPDHYTASILGYEAAFLAGLTKLGRTEPQASTRRKAATIKGSKEKNSKAAPEANTSAAIENELLNAIVDLPPHRPFKIVYASLYHDLRPTFVVDITAQFERRFESLMAYKSQYEDQAAGADIFPARQEIRARMESMARFYGLFAGVTYAEPFVQKEVGLVDDLTVLPVRSL
jgi:N-acetylglucosamine malate deacetylase 1